MVLLFQYVNASQLAKLGIKLKNNEISHDVFLARAREFQSTKFFFLPIDCWYTLFHKVPGGGKEKLITMLEKRINEYKIFLKREEDQILSTGNVDVEFPEVEFMELSTDDTSTMATGKHSHDDVISSCFR